jgi:hypothetical protein
VIKKHNPYDESSDKVRIRPMKTFLIIFLLLYLGCAQERWIQCERAVCKLVDIDEFYRYGGVDGCLLFWEDERTKIKYTEFVKWNCDSYVIGIRQSMLIRK